MAKKRKHEDDKQRKDDEKARKKKKAEGGSDASKKSDPEPVFKSYTGDELCPNVVDMINTLHSHYDTEDGVVSVPVPHKLFH